MKLMTITCLFSILLSLTLGANTALAAPKQPVMSSVALQLKASAWASSKTAKVTVAIDASTQEAEVAQVRSRLLDNLLKLTPKNHWHIVKFDRELDRSGLLQLHLLAQARLAADSIAHISPALKKISKVGEHYKILQVDFTPSAQQYEKVRQQLRTRLYRKVTSEIATLNKSFEQQHYFVKQISFANSALPQQVRYPQTAMYLKSSNLSMSGLSGSGTSEQSFALSNRLTMTASVILVSKAPLDKAKL